MTWLLNFAAEQLYAWQERRRLRQRLNLRRAASWLGVNALQLFRQEFDHRNFSVRVMTVADLEGN